MLPDGGESITITNKVGPFATLWYLLPLQGGQDWCPPPPTPNRTAERVLSTQWAIVLFKISFKQYRNTNRLSQTIFATKNRFKNYRSGPVNWKSFIGMIFLQIKWIFELNNLIQSIEETLN